MLRIHSIGSHLEDLALDFVVIDYGVWFDTVRCYGIDQCVGIASWLLHVFEWLDTKLITIEFALLSIQVKPSRYNLLLRIKCHSY